MGVRRPGRLVAVEGGAAVKRGGGRAILLTTQDTIPGIEFFCWALLSHGGNDDLHRVSCHAYFTRPGTKG